MERFKQWLKLNEMPLAHYGVTTLPQLDPKRDLERPNLKQSQKYASGYFSTGDTAIIKSFKTPKTLEEKLKRVGYNINIILYESTDRSSDIPLEYKQNVENYMIKNRLQKENHITFVKNSSSGDYLTPWMILHTLGHAVTREGWGESLEDNVSNCIRNHYDPNFDSTIRINFKKADLQNLFKFKSLKSSETIVQFSEVVHDLIAEYLWHGLIRLDPTYKDLKDCLEHQIKTVLDRCVGKIIYDWF